MEYCLGTIVSVQLRYRVSCSAISMVVTNIIEAFVSVEVCIQFAENADW